jgi:ABC-type polysaccharide/polyol phosphate transport system ATPase subunit
MGTLMDLCDRVLWIHDSKMMRIGDPRAVIQEYRDYEKEK